MKKIIVSLGLFLLPLAGLAADAIPNPLGEGVTLDDVYVNIINAILGILGGLALLFFIYGGFQFMLAGGNEERVAKAKKSLTWATLGIVVIIMSYSILQFLYAKILV